MDEQDGGLDRLNDLYVTWELALRSFLQGRSQEAPAAGGAGDKTVEAMAFSQGGVVDAFSVPE